ncbi:hypothetical protein CCMSSC00406_0001862 [Pleurotus cornucopiae]|uniref:Uncharacterized protein n=1 Tax=Pleurotus cornucopiae TaxID=5321 RepID=A0ACB7J3J2_PLECO|nr:hypothetical protein CCMSSC00406_0001862 [Pleurotus cornucopiae]
MSARLAKLPPDLPQTSDDGEEEEEELDSVGAPARHPRTKPKREPNPAFAPISAEGLFDSAAQVQVEARGLDVRVYYTPPKFADGTVMVCHHGAGYSGLSFACFAKEIADMTRGECGVLAFDARRHGKTTASSDDENLSIDVLVDDLYELVRTTFQTPKDAPTLVDGGYRVTGVTVIDVVEGSAIDALPHMHSLLNARPDGFDSLEEAIEWHVTTNTIRNVRSARISIPSIFKASEPKSPLVPAYVWRTPLRSTAPYWTSWFKGLSSTFLAARTARLLVLAGHDRLDKELMIGQMQGKFQLMVIPGVGHMVQEDDPTRLAEIVVEFWRRNERVVAGVKRVGEN